MCFLVLQEHQNYLAQDDLLGPVVVSIKREHHPGVGKLYRTIVRTKVNTVHEMVKCDVESTEPSICGLTKVCFLETSRIKVKLTTAFILICNLNIKIDIRIKTKN